MSEEQKKVRHDLKGDLSAVKMGIESALREIDNPEIAKLFLKKSLERATHLEEKLQSYLEKLS